MDRTISECLTLAAQAHATTPPHPLFTRTLAEWEAAFIGICGPIPVKVQEPDARLYEIAFKPGSLTADERAYLAAREEIPDDAWDAAKMGVG